MFAKILQFPPSARVERDRSVPAPATGPQPANADKRKPAKTRRRAWLWKREASS